MDEFQIDGIPIPKNKFQAPDLVRLGPPKDQNTSLPLEEFSIIALQNPSVSLDRNVSGTYQMNLQEGATLLNQVVTQGFWTRAQAEKYSQQYKSGANAFEVMRLNDLVRSISLDQSDVAASYPDEAWGLLSINDVVGNETLLDTERINEAAARYIGDSPAIALQSTKVFDGLYRINLQKRMNDQEYGFAINIDIGKKQLMFLTEQPVSELVYAFSEEIRQNDFVGNLFRLNPRTNIQTPPEVIEKIKIGQEKKQEAKARQIILEQKYKPERYKGWQTTDPSLHAPENFRYIVHAVTSEGRVAEMALARTRFEQIGTDTEEVRGNVFEYPEDFLKRRFLSSSVIDEVHRGTWSGAGVILSVPEDNIIDAGSRDLGTIPNESLLQQKMVPTATEILQGTSTHGYNEVIVSGTNPDTGLMSKIQGVFIVRDIRTGKPKDEVLAKKAYAFALKREVPVIETDEPV